ncbi:hypothetical protein E0L11_16350 [Escherichia coli]|uniref:Uncharacterized protein n=2 Tax=Escherichia coli TaxID=562 RepID=A0A1U9TQ60_ECOLX|nr:hypothetical protein BE964_05490 [Escherichia coli]TLH07714.1 hypothetical protein EWT55_26670 [Escherichia coli O25b:H4]TNA19682.1 hypothetical protein EMF73_33060 [Klebsiella pneumoniae]HAJ7333160.1 hypothetical protein [Escherichia coli UCI 52]AQV46211.1 hypothetical protein BE966_10685 [Escherichia coli]
MFVIAMMVPSFRHHFFNSVFHGPHSYVKSTVRGYNQRPTDTSQRKRRICSVVKYLSKNMIKVKNV